MPTTLSTPLLMYLPSYIAATCWQALEALSASRTHSSTYKTFSGLFEWLATRRYQNRGTNSLTEMSLYQP